MQEDRLTITSRYSNYQLAWRISRYLLVRGISGAIRFAYWAVLQCALVILGLLRLIASPASSGRAQDEFQDLVQSDSPQNLASRGESSDDFWKMYFQAYNPRLWRMRRLMTTIVGRRPRRPEGRDD
ncbi:MAG: hypothetical protein ACE5Q6_00200 [Dehalococcoidia bacterium]